MGKITFLLRIMLTCFKRNKCRSILMNSETFDERYNLKRKAHFHKRHLLLYCRILSLSYSVAMVSICRHEIEGGNLRPNFQCESP